MRKSCKSYQLTLNEFFKAADSEHDTATVGALTKARKKFRQTAFIEIHKKLILPAYYKHFPHKLYKGHRVLAIDGSKIYLPNEENIKSEFGTIRYDNKIDNGSGERASGLASVLYDVFNNMAIDALLENTKAYEVDLAVKHLEYTEKNDLVITDRNYANYVYIATTIKMERHSLTRCSKGSFKQVREMFHNDVMDQIITLKPNKNKTKEVNLKNLPTEIKVRLVKVILNTGETEILLTTLLDREKYPLEDFAGRELGQVKL